MKENLGFYAFVHNASLTLEIFPSVGREGGGGGGQ